MRTRALLILWGTLAIACTVPLAMGQVTASPSQPGDETVTGTVVSSSPTTVVVRSESGTYQLYVFDRFTVKPAAISVGSTVRVSSRASDDPRVRVANSITVTTPAPAATPGAPKPAAPPQEEVIPPSIRDLEGDIKRNTRKYGAGFRAGAGLDPEVLLIGVHARLGPILTQNAAFRPNVEFAFGEVTKLFAINLEGVYNLPITPRTGRWTAYVGLGPSFIFKSQNFERAESGEGGSISAISVSMRA
jgi:hypothetical protein